MTYSEDRPTYENEAEILDLIIEAMLDNRTELVNAKSSDFSEKLRKACREQKFGTADEMPELLAVC